MFMHRGSIKTTNKTIWLFFIMLAAFCVPLMSVSAATYYVDGANIGGTCSDVAAGTGLTTAWCTVGKAASTAVAGDIINIRTATYREVVTPANSGTALNPITYQSYLSESPIVSAAIAGTGFASLAITESTTGLFTDGFENNDNTFQNFNSGAGDTVDAGNTLLIQSSTTNNGAYALAASFGGTNRNARVATTLSSSSPDVYQRMYFRINSSYDIAANDVGQIIMNLRIDSSSSRGTVELLQNAGGQFYLRGRAVNPMPGGGLSTVTFASTTAGSIVPDTWYSVELRYKGGDAVSGGAELWVDQVSAGSNYTFNTSTTSIGRAEWGAGASSAGTTTSGSILYIDDIKVATTTIGAFVAAGPANIYKMTSVSGDPNNIFENDSRLASGSSATTLTAGTYFYDGAGDILYVRTTDSGNPNTKTIDIPFWNEGFLIVNKQYLVFDDIAVKYNDGAGGLDGAYVIATSSNITVQNSDIVDNFGSGVFLHKATSTTVSNNQLLRNQRDFGGGLRLENGSDNNTIIDNTITGLGVDAGNGINICGDDGCGYVGNNNNIIRGNTFYNLRDSCVYIGSLSDNNILEQNSCGLTFRANGVGGTGFHVSRGSDYNIIRNNIFFDMYGASVVIQSNTIDAIEVPVYGNKVLNNVIYNSATAIIGNHGGISVLDDAYDTLIYNNIIYQANDVSGLRVTGAAATSTISDYNIYYSTQPTATNMFHWGVTSGTFYTNLTNFRVAYPALEANSISVDPQFILASARNFLLATTSPAIDIGTTTALVTNDYLGVIRPQGVRYDLGVYERLTTADVTSPLVSAVASTTGNTSATITWTTNEAANSQIVYGTTLSYGATTTLDATLTTSHSVTIASLSPGTNYHFQIRTIDGSSNLATSSDYIFTTTPSSTGGSSGGSSGGGGGGGSRSITPKAVITDPVVTQPGSTAPSRFKEIRFPLGPNMKSDEVVLLQQMLASDVTLYPEGDITGVYGPLTQRAVERFQIKYGLLTYGTPASNGFGNVGPRTLAKLNVVFATGVVNQGSIPMVPANINSQKIAQLMVLLTLLQQLLAIVLAGDQV